MFKIFEPTYLQKLNKKLDEAKEKQLQYEEAASYAKKLAEHYDSQVMALYSTIIAEEARLSSLPATS